MREEPPDVKFVPVGLIAKNLIIVHDKVVHKLKLLLLEPQIMLLAQKTCHEGEPVEVTDEQALGIEVFSLDEGGQSAEERLFDH